MSFLSRLCRFQTLTKSHLIAKQMSSSSSTTTKPDKREKSLNRIELIGRVGSDPRVAGNPDRRVTIFSIATNEYQGKVTDDDTGEIVTKQRVDWHRICVFIPQLRENIEHYLKQGDRLYVSGRLHYDNVKSSKDELKETSHNNYITSIVADEIIFLAKFNE